MTDPRPSAADRAETAAVLRQYAAAIRAEGRHRMADHGDRIAAMYERPLPRTEEEG